LGVIPRKRDIGAWGDYQSSLRKETMMDYQSIKDLAVELGRPVTELLALTPQNDPFYAGTPNDLAMAQWFTAIWRDAGYSGGVHLRRIHYWTVSQDPPRRMPSGENYQNTDKCWKYLCQASKVARYLGMVNISDIADNKNPEPHSYARYWWNDPEVEINAPDIDKPSINVYGRTVSEAQPYHCEIWVEKSTMNDVLLPIAERYGATLVTFEGEVSITSCYQLMRRISQSGGKPTRIFYISDFDPAGNSMPVAMSRKVEFMLDNFGEDYDVKIKPIALTLALIRRYRLPRTPIKETEARASKFEAAFGAGAVELDALEALHPGVLAGIVTAALTTYWNAEVATQVREATAELRAQAETRIAEITSRYQREIDAIRAMTAELRAVGAEIDASEYSVDPAEPHVDESDDWLFDSSRFYEDQIGFYKAHKAGE
jgi:hypothetical protein